ncbi:MAG: type I methionyl aminopeptidase [Myxococcales bacterium]|nr:type I methionyl aminopeptidase [Myxococcales bacterium]MCB9567819.1 type I methionyl aminopeptidase [Myxococcales bacterium]MCB9700265.1 type I methionyl aminopeptidase [Myxococcales bacterium]
MAVEIKSKSDIEKMRATCRLAASVLEYIEPFVQPGVTTEELNRLCHEFIVKAGAYPSPLNYHGFPKSICTSINEVICHGIPGSQTLREGDIINIDITTTLDGYFGDCSDMFVVGGEASPAASKLIDVTRRSLWLGIAEVGPGKRIGDIGAAIYDFAGRKHGYGVVDAFCGHGIGREFHMAPQVSHRGRRGTGLRMKPGMTFTIEPMINEGTHECDILGDGWTAVTRDRRLSAQAEHTILVTEHGYEVLTLRSGCYQPG